MGLHLDSTELRKLFKRGLVQRGEMFCKDTGASWEWQAGTWEYHFHWTNEEVGAIGGHSTKGIQGYSTLTLVPPGGSGSYFSAWEVPSSFASPSYVHHVAYTFMHIPLCKYMQGHNTDSIHKRHVPCRSPQNMQSRITISGKSFGYHFFLPRVINSYNRNATPSAGSEQEQRSALALPSDCFC